ncbi:MAG: YifB family Mg chelatase-like AAA ATPase [Desulfovibrionaceae bacterium]|nr:YifB family Mg chelatase-like AAA ATPase [Desulfovibrionaceae bacterium]
MLAKVSCAALEGVEATEISLEADFTRGGLPSFSLVGLAEGAVREAGGRVFTALRNCGFTLPGGRLTVNLAPADCRKAGSAYDLPLALGLLAATGTLPPEALEGFFCLGELSLTGELRWVPGVLPMAALAAQRQARGLLTPADNAKEAAVISGVAVYGTRNLSEAVAFLSGRLPLEPVRAELNRENFSGECLFDFAEIKGQEYAKRAVELAAAGGHNLLLLGPPGSGKTMLAQRLPGILPPLDFDEALEVTRIYSVAGQLKAGEGLIRRQPFRAPHHTVSYAGLVGGAANPKPGEISLAHRGVLFLDELPEFSKHTLEALRQPLEDGKITLSRAAAAVSYPARIMLVAAMNPCPCGYYGDPSRRCACSPKEVLRYRARLSGPLLDRLDLHIEVPAVPYAELRARAPGASSAQMRVRVVRARELQRLRYAGSVCRSNADLYGNLLEKHCALDEPSHKFLGQAMQKLGLSARAHTRILRLARTIADLAEEERLEVRHLAEAINCRALDRERT